MLLNSEMKKQLSKEIKFNILLNTERSSSDNGKSFGIEQHSFQFFFKYSCVCMEISIPFCMFSLHPCVDVIYDSMYVLTI